jgi:hypothetical protein
MKGIMEHQEVGARKANSIIEIVAKVTGLQMRKLKSQSRRRQVVDIRRMCMKLIRAKLGLPTPVIGAIFDRDHATILHNINQHEDLYEYDMEYQTLYDTLKIAIGLKADLGKEETLFIERLVARVSFLEQENETLHEKIKKIEETLNT